MNVDTWAVVLATAAGPIGAVLITFWRERHATIRNRRLEIFRVLMATRQIPISREHVNALNLIEVDFYACENVQREWSAYKAHLNVPGAAEDNQWREQKERLLANLLFQRARTLRFNIPAMEIFKGGYAPVGWINLQSRIWGALEFVHDLSTGAKSLPMQVNIVTTPESSQSSDKTARLPSSSFPPNLVPPIS